MIFLYGENIGSLGQPMPDDIKDKYFFNACQLLLMRGESAASALLAAIPFEVWAEWDDHDNSHYMGLYVGLQQYEYFKEHHVQDEFQRNFKAIAAVLKELGIYIYSIFVEPKLTEPPSDWRGILAETLVTMHSNQALFTYKNTPKLLHSGLNFRSRTETRVFDVLVRRGVLVLPLPVAVLGKPNFYKEPDFLVCAAGKWGILEIHGDEWHPPETAAKEHERRRLFTTLGVKVYEIYDAQRCYNATDQVVDEFLRGLAQS